LVKIMRIGICGSDIHTFHGKHPYVNSYPVTQGHEVSGRIEKTDSMITEFEVGDKVTIQPQEVCGTCYPCIHNQYHCCDNLKVLGFQTIGMASEYFVCDVQKLVKLPQSMTYEEGAMIEPLAVACHAVNLVQSVKGLNILVLGAGPIGNLVGQTVKAKEANSVLITDISDFRLKIANEVGLNNTFNPSKGNLSQEILKRFDLNKADLIIECVGRGNTINDAIYNARKNTDIIVVGVFPEKPNVDFGLVQNNELRIHGSAMYQTQDFLTAINLVNQKKINLPPLMTKHFQFHEYQKAYEFLEQEKDKAMKVFVDIDNW
ncbi:MAG: zinc-binding dehydrogenase, partial [Candidatus Thorarchaeota archaeon]